MESAPTQRFTSRVENYVRYRPGYPAEIIRLLEREIGLADGWRVVDIGSGPGNLTRVFLDDGLTVTGVEPNDAMRAAGEALLASYPKFTSAEGTAENTGLPSDSFNLATAGQAFHWFEPESTRCELQRILKAPGWVALIWNKRPEGASPLLDDYSEMLLRYSNEYDAVRLRDDRARAGVEVLFGPEGYRMLTIPHEQMLGAGAFWGRLLSSSYTPLAGEPGHDQIRKRSQEIFAEYAVEGAVHIPYETQIFLGQVSPSQRD